MCYVEETHLEESTEIIKGMSEFNKCKPKETREANISIY